jgi:hypothetical protein
MEEKNVLLNNCTFNSFRTVILKEGCRESVTTWFKKNIDYKPAELLRCNDNN